VSPAGLAGKALLEVSIPVVVGTVIGTVFALAMVVLFGPAPALDSGAYRGAAWGALAAAVIGFVTVATVVGARSRAAEVRRSRRSHLGAIPWELALIALTVVAYRRLEEWGVPVGSGPRASEADPWGLMFPVLFLITVVAVVSRVLAIAAKPLRVASRSWPVSAYVGAHRISRYRVAVLGLLAASAIATGVIGYSTTFDESLETTLRAKTLTYVGSDTAVRLLYGQPVPTIELPSTEVELHRDVWIELGGEEVDARLLAIDPATFESAAFWDDSFSSTSLDEIVRLLSEPRADGRIPAVVADAAVTGPTRAAIIEQTNREFTLEPIAQVTAFPGMSRVEPVIFVDAAALEVLDVRVDQLELWVRGDTEVALAELDAEGARYAITRGVDEIADRAAFLTVSWTFGFMEAIGWAAGVLVIAGVGVYLDARRRARVLGYSFARRMGLARAQHRRALFVEISASVIVGCWLGLVASLVGAWFALQLVDPVPSFAPPTLWRVAVPTIAGLAIAAVLLTVVAAFVAQRRTDRDNPVEVLRGGV
jgi:putative ABC transport system permease protein